MKLQKLTKERRRYDDACGTAHALDLIGERWALLIMRELMLGPKRFSDIKADLPGLSGNVLTQRLEGLEASGLLTRRKLPPPANIQVYELTAWGYEAEPIVQSLGRWAARSPAHDPSLPISAVSLMLSFKTMFDAQRAGGLSASIGFRIGEESFMAKIDDGSFSVARGDPSQADVIFTGPAAIIAASVYGGQSFATLQPNLIVEGDLKLAERFTTLFPLPEKVKSVN